MRFEMIFNSSSIVRKEFASAKPQNRFLTFLDKEYAWRDEAIGTSRLLFRSNFYSQTQIH